MTGEIAEGSIDGRQRAARIKHRRWLKRMAVQISAQLPEDPQDAAQVLAYMRELQADFFADDEDAGGREALGQGVVARIGPPPVA